MRIVFDCPKCDKTNKVEYKARTRFRLFELLGEKVTVSCRHCQQTSEIHINRFYAKKDRFLVSIFVLILGVSSLILPYVLFMTYQRDTANVDLKSIALATAGFVVPILILSALNHSWGKKAKYFNSFKL